MNVSDKLVFFLGDTFHSSATYYSSLLCSFLSYEEKSTVNTAPGTYSQHSISFLTYSQNKLH